jgi:hypothetical protein
VLSVAALVAAMADSQYWYNLNLVGLRLKTALSAAIYKKSLVLSNSSRREKTGKMVPWHYINDIQHNGSQYNVLNCDTKSN